jgi:hypothetical protein
MASKTNTFENKTIDFLWRAQSLTIGGATATWNQAPVFTIGLINVSLWNPLQTINPGVFIIAADTSGTYHLLKSTGSTGITSSVAPVAPTSNDGTVTDGTVTWTDQYTVLEAATIANLNGSVLPLELTGGSPVYSRQTFTASTTSMAATNAAGSTVVPSTGITGTTSNNTVITFNSGGSSSNIGLFFISDVAAINIYAYGFISTGPSPCSADSTLTFPAGYLQISDDN